MEEQQKPHETNTTTKDSRINAEYKSIYDLFPDKNVLIKILNHVFGDIMVVNAEGKIIFFSDICSEIFGLSSEEFININVYDFEKLGLSDRYPATADALDKKTQVMKFIKNKEEARVVASTPIFDENGDVEMAVVYSLPEELLDQFSNSVKKQRDLAEKTIKYLETRLDSGGAVISTNKKMQDIYRFALRAAAADSTITLYGESGTGKEVFAHYIHRNSNRKDRKFIPVNCAAIPQELVESELFGYESGAFTGAKGTGKPGLFEIANEGTIFLDEIGELPLLAQSKMLRVLETGDIIRIGSNKVRRTNVRIITATNRDLLEMTRKGTFREDLYYRLHVLPITLPPLRERFEDIIPLANYFVELNNVKNHDSKVLSERTAQLFLEYKWPGNIRELKNIVERLCIVTSEKELNIEKEMLFGPQAPGSQSSGASVFDYGSDYAEAMKTFERKFIQEVIKQCRGNITLAAKKLGLHRSSIYKKLEMDTELPSV